MSLYLSELFCYPVKSLGEISLEQATIDRFGLCQDRRWMVVDDNGHFLTQRQLPRMVAVGVERQDSGWLLKAGDCSMTFSEQDVAADCPERVKVWRDTVAALPARESINDWLSEQLQHNCRLVYMPESTRRKVDPEYARHGETLSFADGFPVLLTCQASLDAFNDHLSQPVEMLRFRPNIVVAGGTAWQEDSWRRVRIGALEFEVAKPCSRCAIPTINRQTLAREPEVFKALKDHRSRNGEVYFGQNLLPRQAGTLQLGDLVDILE
ncbi:MAG: MOSC domain-containing protein [Ketobacteraceae bacterium]|nr:MOSC domain-containing protein [Ketobacteraceae bacterium]